MAYGKHELAVRERFLNDTKDHTLRVKEEDGLYRHIRMMKGSSSVYYFDIVTWPGHLVITGDMGSFHFSRIDDMFEFFVGHSDKTSLDNLMINTGYWQEKLQCANRKSESEEFCQNTFWENIKSDFDCQTEHLSQDEKDSIWKDIKEHFEYVDETQVREMISAAMGFSSDEVDFSEFYEYTSTEYTLRFTWCLFGIVKAILLYREQKDDS